MDENTGSSLFCINKVLVEKSPIQFSIGILFILHQSTGNPYADIGRILLRVCNSIDEAFDFFKYYSTNTPNSSEFRDGLIYFCGWQNNLRKEKNLPYQEVSILRKRRIESAADNLESIFHAFKLEVSL